MKVGSTAGSSVSVPEAIGEAEPSTRTLGETESDVAPVLLTLTGTTEDCPGAAVLEMELGEIKRLLPVASGLPLAS
jgi:hypothetical protein